MKKMMAGIFCFLIILAGINFLGCRERSLGNPEKIPTATITLTGTITQTGTITPTATISPTYAPVNLNYDFEGSLNGWVKGGDPGFTGITYVNQSAVPGGTVPSGSYCAAATCNFTGGNMQGEVTVSPSPANLSGANIITAKVYLPSNLPAGYSVNVFILAGAAFTFTGNNHTTLTAGAWNDVSLDITSAPGKDDVRIVAVQLNENNNTPWSGTIYLDDVKIY